MADIILKDISGADVTYTGVKTIQVPKADGVEEFINPQGNINITDTQITDVRGKATAQVVDANLIAENIAKDVTVLGITGTHEGGGTDGYYVKVIDYDGTILAEECMNEGDVFTLPNAPSHDRLVFDGWSSSTDIVDGTITIENNDVMVGAMYHTVSGTAEFDIELNDVIGLTFTFNNVLTGMTSIDWGDGTVNNTLSHAYASAGEYTVKVYGLTAIKNGGSSGGVVSSSGKNRYLIKAVFFSNSVTSIGSNAFQNCYNLTSATIGNGVTSIGNSAFQNCYSLTSATIGNGVTSIGNFTFSGCYNLTTVTIPDSVTSIGERAFYGCYSLTSVTIPDGVTSIGNTAFNNCYSLTSATIGNGVTSIGSNAFQNCYSLTSITIPDGVTSIGNYAFNGCYNLTSATIGNGVTSIGNSAFNGCYNLTSVTIGNGVTSIGDSTFSGCHNLTTVTIPDGVTSIGNYAFYGCYSLTSITIPDGVTSIGNYAFANTTAVKVYDFSSFAIVPKLSNTNAFNAINGLCKMLIPSALYDTWKTATNWSTYASYMIPV